MALVPARSGSKRIKNKNIKIFLKKPLIYWTIRSAKKSKYIDKICVSTDSKKIATISKKYGAQAQFLRSKKISKTHSVNSEYIIDFIKKSDDKFDILIILQPTSPLRVTKDIDQGLKLFMNNSANLLLGCFELNKKSKWLLKFKIDKKNLMIKNKHIINILKKEKNKKFIRNGSMFIFTKEYFLKNNSYESRRILIKKIPTSRSIDIDYPEEFLFAENKFKKKKINVL